MSDPSSLAVVGTVPAGTERLAPVPGCDHVIKESGSWCYQCGTVPVRRPIRFPVGVVALTEPCERCATAYDTTFPQCEECHDTGRLVSGYAMSGDDGTLTPLPVYIEHGPPLPDKPEGIDRYFVMPDGLDNVTEVDVPAIGEPPLPGWPTLKGTP